MARINVTAMVRGMGMGMRVLELLIDAAKTQGADEEVFALLTRPRFKTNLERIGKAIAECDWRVPASEMRSLSTKHWTEEFELDPEEVEQATNLWWCGPCQELGIPFDGYSQDPDDGNPAIPTLIFKALHGQVMRYPLIISPFIDNNLKKVVVDFEAQGIIYNPGDVINAKRITSLAIADCKYFDFGK